jgi:hypothetical protein
VLTGTCAITQNRSLDQLPFLQGKLRCFILPDGIEPVFGSVSFVLNFSP